MDTIIFPLVCFVSCCAWASFGNLSLAAAFALILGLLPDGVVQVWVGIFQWGPALNGNLIGECRSYTEFFNGGDQYYLEVAQICAIIAPSELDNVCYAFFASKLQSCAQTLFSSAQQSLDSLAFSFHALS